MSLYEDLINTGSQLSTLIPETSDAQRVAVLNDAIPALLLPYRMETRFQQKEYKVIFITERQPDLPRVPPIGIPGLDLPEVNEGIDLNPDTGIPILDAIDFSYKVTTDFKTFQDDLLIRCCYSPPVGEDDIPEITGRLTHQLETILAQLGGNFPMLTLANTAGKNSAETAFSKMKSSAIQTNSTAQEQESIIEEVIAAVEEGLVVIGENFDTLLEQFGTQEIADEVGVPGTEVKYQIFHDALDHIEAALALRNDNAIRGDVFSAAIIDMGECTGAAIRISKALVLIDEEQLTLIANRINDLIAQFNEFVVFAQELILEFQRQLEALQEAKKLASEVLVIADDYLDRLAILPILPDTADLPPLPIYEIHERIELRWELLVRVYPDEIEIDTHEQELTDAEYRDGRLFWESIWFDPTNQEKGLEAWRALIAAYGRPRAAWIVKATTPTNLEIDLSLFDIPETVVSTFSPVLPSTQIEAGKQYWDAVWNSDGSKAAYEEAWNTLNNEFPSPASNIIAYATTPNNIDARSIKKVTDFAFFDNSLFRENLPPEYPLDKEIEDRVRDIFRVQKIPNQAADPVFPPQERREDSWTRAPLVRVLPDRFTVITQHQYEGRNEYAGNAISNQPLAVGLNPSFDDPRSADDPIDTYFEGEEILNGQVDEDFEGIEESIPQMEPELKWMSDFNEAERIGMGIRINLGTAQPIGFDKVFVLGLKTQNANPAETGKNLLDELFTSLHYTGAGLSLLKQGMPTNNTEEEDAAFNGNDATGEESYKNELTGPLFSIKQDRINKRDGQWLAEMLGIEYSTVFNLDNADNLDVANAFAMNQALVSGTMLPFAEQLLSKQFVNTTSPDQALYYLDELRSFFTKNVTGRGIIPPIRVDSQPYGIMATTAFSKWQRSTSDPVFHTDLKSILSVFDRNWDAMRKQFVEQVDQPISVPGIDRETDPVAYADKELELGQARFMKLLGLNPISTEWYQQLGMSQGPSGANLIDLLEQANFYSPDFSHRNLLINELGVASAQANANLIDKLQWFGENQRLRGGLVDKLEAEGSYLSELLSGRNYIDLLLDASLPTIRSQDYHLALDPDAGTFNYPNSLLYLYLRYALLNQYYDSGMRLLDTVVNDTDNLFGTKARISLNVFQSAGANSNTPVTTQWDYLLQDFSNYSLKSGFDFSNYNHLAEYLRTTYRSTDFENAKAQLLETRKALEVLSGVPVRNLERDFLEHLDLCNYRFDAWQTGLVNHRLQKQREDNRSGVYLGGFSWVENLRPEDNLERVPEDELPEDLNPEDRELYYDPKNMGLILAPSHQHAVGAAVLRNAYVSNYESNNNSKVAVNLSSERIRLARYIIEGVRNGQSLSALLGYRFERTLLDRSLQDSSLNLEQYILDIRKKYPLSEVENQEESEDTQAVKDSIAANNVVDGLLLFENHRDQEADFVSWINNFNTDEKAAIEDAINMLANAVDAISDVAVCEAVFHTIGGNAERAKAFSQALAKNGLMPTPEAFEIKNNGITITHTLGVSFPPVRETTEQIALNNDYKVRSPRSLGEPSLDQWLAGILPSTENIRLTVNYEGLDAPQAWSAAGLHLYPIDLLYLVRPTLRNDDGGLATYVRHQIRCESLVPEDVKIDIDFSTAGLLDGETENPNRVSFSELELAIEKINTLIGKGSAMTSEHFQRYDDPSTTENNDAFFFNNPKGYDVAHLRQRVEMLIDGDFFVGENDIGNLGNSPLNPFNPGGVFGNNETLPPPPILLPVTDCNLPFRGIGILVDEINQLTRQASSNPFEQQTINKAIKTRLLQLWKYGFDMALPGTLSTDADTQFQQLYKIGRTVVSELSPKVDQARTLAQSNLEDDNDTAYEKLQEAVSLITGYNFKLFPLFRVINQQEVNQGVQSTQIYNPELTEDPDLPEAHNADEVELLMKDWLGDVARMRKPVAIMDDAMMYAENVMTEDPAFSLHPIQYPGGQENFWLGMEFPDTGELEMGKKSLVLYGDKPTTGYWCGLVIDEWNETIPDKNRNVAVAFHYDQPNAKAPNCLLLAVTPEETGQWSWEDLVDTLDETLEMAKKRAVEPEHMDEYKKDRTRMFPKIFPALAAPILDAERGFSLDLAENNNARLYERKTFAKDAGVTLSADGSHFENEDRTKDEPDTAGEGGFAVQLGRTGLEIG